MPVDDDGYCPGGKCGYNRRDPRNAKKQTRQRSREVQEFADMLKQEFSPNSSHHEGTVFDCAEVLRSARARRCDAVKSRHSEIGGLRE